MKHLKPLTTVIATLLIIITSCKKDSAPLSNADSKLAGKPQTEMALNKQARLRKLRSTLPATYRERLQKSVDKLLLTHPQYRNVARQALAIEPTECSDATPIRQWLNVELTDWDDDVIFFALVTGILDIPFLHTLYFENSPANQYFGVNGEYTHTIEKTFKDLKRFSNIQTNGMIIVGMHGKMLLDREKVIQFDRFYYGDSQEDAAFWADLITSLVNEFPQYRNGDHPIFTFNAFAVPRTEVGGPVGTIPNKIAMGDGIMDGYARIGFGDVAPQAILAHEFAHQVQFQLGLYDGEGSPEGTRSNELLADAYSAYYLSHARGASMQWKRVQQFLQVFLNIGDCSFDSSNHHGTPAERMAAAKWGYSIANNAQKQGHILTSQQFVALFNKQLPVLVAR
ncbi:hypothetical protein GZH53_06810 [Flavihumibacter sp. R14]|nr:hypothetical protein [Flavihumibacter soli]